MGKGQGFGGLGLWGLAGAIILSLAPASASAHKGHGGLTVIEIDPALGTVSVSHRFPIHDIEPALPTIATEVQPSLDDPLAVQALETHLVERFRLDVDGVAISVAHAATELAGDNAQINYTGQMPVSEGVRSVRVDMDYFPGVHDDQEQQVNVRTGGVTRTVVFRPGSQAQRLDF